jgi:hypothetical protein
VPNTLPIAEMTVIVVNFQDDLTVPLSVGNPGTHRIGVGIPLGKSVKTPIAFTIRPFGLWFNYGFTGYGRLILDDFVDQVITECPVTVFNAANGGPFADKPHLEFSVGSYSQLAVRAGKPGNFNRNQWCIAMAFCSGSLATEQGNDCAVAERHNCSPTPTPTISVTPTVSETPTVTTSLSVTSTISVSPSVTPSISVSASATPSVSRTPSPSVTPTASASYIPAKEKDIVILVSSVASGGFMALAGLALWWTIVVAARRALAGTAAPVPSP